ncbi:SERTA domain-containing protein 1 [Spea bombifrons]|uniref:SERTA domain-containing protein 1 n=1 Tax=Spea bombifrons TaxID=233779 RepID=UPI00234BA270|nr:SERTA domain-containing protein 1 [Spea bombifrons]
MLAKGTKRKRSEVDDGESVGPQAVSAGGGPSSLPAVQSHCLMNISLVKLHRSLRHVEPNLRHLVLVANTLRRLQEEPSASGAWRVSDDLPRRDHPQGVGSEGKKPESVGEDPLLSSMDASLYSSISTILEDLNHFEGLSSSPLPLMEDDQLCSVREGGRDDSGGRLTAPANFLASSTYLLGDNLEDIFEDIDTSMYDSEPWPSASLLNFKAFSNADDPGDKPPADGPGAVLELSDLDYLMDVLVGAQNC